MISHLRKLSYAIVVLLAACPAWAEFQPRCDSSPRNQVCVLSYGRVTVRIESDEANAIRRFILYTDDRTGEADRLAVAVGKLMMMVKPSSTADERSEFMLSALKNE